jgi:hypothetical protein
MVTIDRLAEMNAGLVIDRPTPTIGRESDMMNRTNPFRVVGAERQNTPAADVRPEFESYTAYWTLRLG